ncbi:MAG: tRNA (N6-isopentenyl adenosine(37)-C2)-methylthiotransferase MiaB [Verrucomicrobiota bacterium]
MSVKFYIRTYGCQMNERDSEALISLLEENGMQEVSEESDADVLVFNTCSVRDQAERKVVGKVGLLKKLKRQKPDIVIAVIGCMAQNHGDRLLQELPHIDIVAGTDHLHELPELIADVRENREKRVATEPSEEISDKLTRHVGGKMSAYVAVMRGCNQFCSYCIVPYVRGREKSRGIDDIVREVEGLVAQGVKEVFLLGQNITAYQLAEQQVNNEWSPENSPFADLLQEINDVPGLERIRFTSPHPKYMNDKFIQTAASLSKVCEHFHLPLQSGSDHILQAMRRGYTRADFMHRIDRLRAALPQVSFSTDIIVGFPGETEEDFNATRETMDEAGFDMAYIFKYSPRQGTKACQWADNVPREIKEERNQILLEDLEKRALAHNQAYPGSCVEVLVEGESKRNNTRWAGRTRNDKVCLFDVDDSVKPGQIRYVKIQYVTANSLFGVLHPR